MSTQVDTKGTRLIITIAVILCGYYYNSCRYKCNMSKAENRDFNSYYGILGVKNHFTTSTADQCNANIIYKPAFRQPILTSDNSASSFLTLATYGTGKTLLRCEYYKSLNANNYFTMLLLNKRISEYLERFVTKITGNGKNCEETSCLNGWSENEFAQLLLSTLVTEFISIYQHKKIHFKKISIEEKIELISIICYYYNGFGTTELEHFVNDFLEKPLFYSRYRAHEAVVQVKQRNVAQDKQLLIHFKKDLEKFSALNQNPERLYLLLAVVEDEGFENNAIVKNMYDNLFNDLTQFSLAIKEHMERTPVFIIDGIDENQYLFQNKSIDSFYRSSVSQQILSKVMANDFFLSIFYPKINGINIQDVIIRKDKFPIYDFSWNTKSLINYADYVLQQMNKDATYTRCKSFKNFKTLVNYYNEKIAEIINKIPTPRALNYFMIELITEMNNDANEVEQPFIATFENVDNAYNKSCKHYNNDYQVKEEKLLDIY